MNWLYRWLPVRRRIGADPLAAEAAAPVRFRPMPVDRLKVTANLHHDILATRSMPPPFTMDHGRRLAVIIPFRDREEHLSVLLPALHRQVGGHCADYRVFVVEQVQGRLFNRARLINIGAHVAGDGADYFCIHDVDAIPIDADYGCPAQPLRLITRLEGTFRPVTEFTGYYFSGSIALRREHFLAANGFDNDYWGVGSQDEDFFIRCLLKGLVPHEDREGRFTELTNPPTGDAYRSRRIRRGNKRRMIRQCYSRRIGTSGMNNLQYRLIDRRDDGPVTRIRVEI